MNKSNILDLIKCLRNNISEFEKPAADLIAQDFNNDPFAILVSCLLSLRAKDTASYPISKDLLQIASTPQKIVDMSLNELEKIIYSVGFYRQKAKTLIDVSNQLLSRFSGKVPDNEVDLLSIKGIGRKTANLVLGIAFKKPAICVDIHVHRISNRLGIVDTKTPSETETELQKIIPKENWIEWNQLLVTWGQNICTPISPKCTTCPILGLCKQKGIKNYR